ncbi:MAG TPA: hypothetical protein PKW35_19920 [Nannocystaceae bacterium]|nr:hypothetical protein [Nannocystaceae bacterium]
MLVVGAIVVLTRGVDLARPDRVRGAPVAVPPGEAPGLPSPSAELRGAMGTADAVQVRATLRAIEDPQAQRTGAAEVPSKVLAQPVVATMVGIPATVDQKVRFDDGALEIVVSLVLTPRAGPGGMRAEESLRVVSRRRSGWEGRFEERLHLESTAEVVGVESRGRRWVFAVDERLFSLDVDVQRAG